MAIYERTTKTPHNTAETHSNVRVEKGLRLRFESKSTTFLALVKPNRLKPCLRQDASSGVLRGRFRQAPLTSRGGSMVAASPRPNPGWIQAHSSQGSFSWLELPGHSPTKHTKVPTVTLAHRAFASVAQLWLVGKTSVTSDRFKRTEPVTYCASPCLRYNLYPRGRCQSAHAQL